MPLLERVSLIDMMVGTDTVAPVPTADVQPAGGPTDPAALGCALRELLLDGHIGLLLGN